MTRGIITASDAVKISGLIIKLFRYMRHGLDRDERIELANDIADVVAELLK
jgi:hypothetical protein